jgi:arylsulfatase
MGDSPPNFVIIFTDDQGYNDLGCYGSKRLRTPLVDGMASRGVRFTQFYVGSSVCTPSRAALLTGCYPKRISMSAIPWEINGEKLIGDVLRPNSEWGLNTGESTIALLLRQQGYATACIGKWHLGDAPVFLPTRHGFDSYLGIPYSNDMKPTCLMRDEAVIEEDTDQESLTDRYTDAAVDFIRRNGERPFFLYFAHNMPHTPLHAPERFRGRSKGGLYGDVIEHIDWSTGEILNALDELGIMDSTLVMFASDNGPWYLRGEHGGNATPLRASKGATYEGGFRVPCVIQWPARIRPGIVCDEVATTMDILPTFVTLAGGKPPQDRIIDGRDILPLMVGEAGARSPHEAFYYYFLDELQAVRSGNWKLKYQTKLLHEDKYVYRHAENMGKDAVIPEALYDLDVDPGEQKNVIQDHQEVAAALYALADRARQDMGDSATGNPGTNVRPIGRYRRRP